MAKKKPSKKSKSRKQQKKKKPSFLFRCAKLLFVLGIWGAIALGATILWFAKDLPDITQSATFERRASIIVQASGGETLARYGESKGKTISSTDIPKHLVNAILATEDRRFYNHHGVDPLGITRAMLINLYHGRFVQGGSTITQQLAKNLFLSHKRKITRKIQEALLALWRERELTTDEILSAYINRVYLGSGTYGFEAAAQLYFGKSARNVNIREAATLAGLLKAPSKYSPLQNPDLAKERSDVVLLAMHDAGFLDKTELEAAKKMPLTPPPRATAGASSDVRYFTDWVINGLDDIIGVSDTDIIIQTTLDLKLQETAQRALKKTIDSADEMQFLSQGAILSMRPDGAIIAMVGGYDYNKSQFNRTIQAKRPPGSAFKPIVFLTALQQGWKPSDKILDSPITSGEYRPQNFANSYYGTVDLETALAKSLNTATVRLAQDVGINKVIKTAQRLGILSPLSADLSLALGSSGVSMLELATSYAVVANGGYKVFPYAISRIKTQDGEILFERSTNQNYQSIIRPQHISDLSLMLRSVINNGTGQAAKLPFPAQGKTGTSQDSRDAWFAGYTNKLVTLVWLGNDDNSPMRRVTGGSLPAQIWYDVMLAGNPRQPQASLSQSNQNNENGFSGLLKRLTDAGKTAPTAEGNFSNLND